MRTFPTLAVILSLSAAGCGNRSAPAVEGDGGSLPDTGTAADLGGQSDGSGLKTVQCTTSAQCGAKSYCFFAQGCGATGPGTCKARPKECPAYCPGVCGCDGKTHCSACTAAIAGTSVAHSKACSSPGGCATNQDCKAGEFCQRDGMCTVTGAKMGSCVVRPQTCYTAYVPVCGCDGKTYGNGCVAHKQGVSVAYNGKCTSCGDLSKAYGTELTKARKCSTLINTPQCTITIDSSLMCGCLTYVDKANGAALKALKDLAAKWTALKCPTGDCGPCKLPKGGKCTGPGPSDYCVDVFGP